MIDFRYHLVSIVAVFLALAVGIIVGASALQPQVVSGLKAESQSEKKTNEALRAELDLLNRQLSVDELFGQADAGYLLAHLLQGKQVVLVTAPLADSQTVTGITTALHLAGATVTGQVSLTAQFFDISKTTESNLTALAQSLASSAGISLPASAAVGSIYGQQAAAQLIADAIVTKDGLATVTPSQSQSILSGFGTQGFLQVSGARGTTTLAGQATLAVVVIPATPAVNASSDSNLALVTVASGLERAGAGALLAGSLPGSGTGSAIDAVTSGAAGVALFTVDNANTSIGQIMVVQTLAALLSPHAVATAYGVVPAAVPSPAPSTAPSTSPTPSPSPSSSQSPRRHAVTS